MNVTKYIDSVTVNGHLGCFEFLDIKSKVGISILVPISV